MLGIYFGQRRMYEIEIINLEILPKILFWHIRKYWIKRKKT